MKKFLLIITALAGILLSGCTDKKNPVTDKEIVTVPTGPILLEDAGFGIYYGDKDYNGIGVFDIALTNARCYQDKSDPYLDSEGDLLVLQFRSHLISDDAEIVLPIGDYTISSEAPAKMTVSAETSYMKRFVGSTQYKWSLKSGVVTVKRGNDGKYEISTKNLVVTNGEKDMEVEYTCYTDLSIADYMAKAPGMYGQEEDLIDLPFADVMCDYYGNLYGYGTGNFVLTMATKDLLTDETGHLPGVLITINAFSRLYATGSTPILETGRYNITSITSNSLFTRWTLLPGVLMEENPFGTYVYQQVEDAPASLEFISSGYIDVSYDEENFCTLVYDLKSSSRKISGIWRGLLPAENYAEDKTSEPLSTLENDVECNMSKVTRGTIRHIETLHRDNVEAELDYDIAEAWQLYLQPRDWTPEEYDIPYYDDKDGNGISDRIDSWCADGDVMVLEFILPLDCDGNIAPEINREYTYTMQPNLSLSDYDYEACVSSMGRPDDEVFDPNCAHFGYSKFMTGYDYCNGRRGFTWSDDGYRGNWYLHYQTNRHFILDGHAPAVHGTIMVTRTTEIDADTNIAEYTLEWDFKDDAVTQNSITGSWSGPITIIK